MMQQLQLRRRSQKKQNELAIKRSELQQEADTKKRIWQMQLMRFRKRNSDKTIEVTTANADIAKQEREIELKQKEVAVKEQAS